MVNILQHMWVQIIPQTVDGGFTLGGGDMPHSHSRPPMMPVRFLMELMLGNCPVSPSRCLCHKNPGYHSSIWRHDKGRHVAGGGLLDNSQNTPPNERGAPLRTFPFSCLFLGTMNKIPNYKTPLHELESDSLSCELKADFVLSSSK